jgi:DNA-binding HxlR family transcriptional regulator
MKKLDKTVSRRSDCPIATALDVLGDKWTLLIIRDIALFDKHKNKDFQTAGEDIPTNILANRLQFLVTVGLLEKRLYQTNPPRYDYYLTDAGTALVPVLKSIAAWSARNIDGVTIPEPMG